MKQLKYDYTKLDEFFQEDNPEKECLFTDFAEFCSAYSSMATWIVYKGSHGEVTGTHVNPDGAAFMHRFLELFRILNDLPKVQEGGES